MGLAIDVNPIEPARLQVLRKGIDLSNCYIYLDAFMLDGGSPTITIEAPNTSMMGEYWDEEGDGVFTCGVTDQILVHPDLMRLSERERLLAGTGSICTARLSFRTNGDAPALIEGRDFKLLAPLRIELVSIELCEADW
jgi:hypothetical protein